MRPTPSKRIPNQQVPSSSMNGDQYIAMADLPNLLREDLEDAPFWKEVVAFSQIPQSDLDPYYGQYVAIYEGNIVDNDPDEGELALRFYRTFGYVPVYIHKVGIEDGLIDVAE